MRLISLLGIALFAAPAHAQSNAALMASDHYSRSHDYDLVHQRIVVSGFNWDSSSFDGITTTTLVALRPGLDSLILDEGALLLNSAVADRAGRALRTRRQGDTLIVFPAAPLAVRDTLVFTVTYHGKVQGGHGLTFITSDGLPHRPNQIWSMGETYDNHSWFPTYDFPNDKMTWELVATVPVADRAISNGRLVSNVVHGADRTMTWRQELPSATYLVSLIVAPLAEVRDSWKNIPVNYYVYHEDSVLAWPLFHETVDVMGVYSRLTGVPYPWAKYAQTTVADFFGGMENVSATTLVDWLPDHRAYLDRPWYSHVLIPHELAHQWFGDYVTLANWANMWLNEGFADFMPGQYWAETMGTHAGQDYYVDEYRQYLVREGQQSMPLASLGSNNVYPKGALVLEMLQQYLGPDRFWASAHRYLADHALGTANSDDLRQAVLDATGENLDWFWNEWVYSAGHPKLRVAATYDSAAAVLTLAVSQTQADSLPADSTGLRFSVPAAFRMPVTIRVGTSRGDVTSRVMLTEREQTITIPGVAAAPTMVIFDDGNAVLKELSFQQPTAWLATQLRRDSNLWNRQWVIGELTNRAGDADAAAALADAAVHADYFLTRQEAVGALAHFPAASAAPAGLAALRDTSSAVRAAAVSLLGQLSASGSADSVRARFTSDSSYTVRAAALGALIRLDPARSHEAISAGLRMSSYMDVIQNAALRGAVQTGDTSFVAEVDSLIASNELAPHALAVFAGRGNVRALDLLTKHLDDARTVVRHWTLDAFQGELATLDRAAALDRLRSTQAGLTHSDAQVGVAAAIAGLQRPPQAP